MNREIKFRGWDLKNYKWIYGSLIEKIKPTEAERVFWGYLIHDGALSAELVAKDSVGQFTGLKDKNGKEIYEGDIVKWVSVHNDSPKPRIDAIEWQDDCACFMLMPFVHEPNGAIMEVIGNKFETPELL